MNFATLDMTRIKGGTNIAWCWWPDTKGETLTTIRGCKWAKWQDENGASHPYDTCRACYAQMQSHTLVQRFDQPHYRGLTKLTPVGPIWNGDVRFDEEQLLSILTMTKARTLFCSSMGDLLFGTTDNTVAYHVAVALLAHWHRLLILTKRPDRLAQLWASDDFWASVDAMVTGLRDRVPTNKRQRPSDNALRRPGNIWLGTSIEGIGSAKWALDHLTSIDHPGRLWVSYEPMIEFANLNPWLPKLSWVVLGGASKQGAEPAHAFNVEYAESIVRSCRVHNVALFIKQLGARPITHDAQLYWPEMNNHNDDPQHWPVDLRVQQFPVPA